MDKEDQKRQEDLDFILKLKLLVNQKNLNLVQLMQRNYSHKLTPKWKKIALDRAINQILSN